MIESAFGTKFQNWWKRNKTSDCAAFEYKVTNGGTYNLSTWRRKQGHQEAGLKKVDSNTGVIFKLSDLDPRSKPFDAFYISNAPAYLVIWFNKYKKFFMIPVKEIPKQTSLSYDQCCDRWVAYELREPKRKVINI